MGCPGWNYEAVKHLFLKSEKCLIEPTEIDSVKINSS